MPVPGITVEQALTLVPNPTATHPVFGWANIVLGFPSPFAVPGPAQQAVALHPTTAIIWLGNNDARLPALFGGNTTPFDKFGKSYAEVLLNLSLTKAHLAVANIPDIPSSHF
ncbi:MAG TPA: hypothetical protein VKV17_20460 [Bryobacteraceae bacterium]|nr:hypothetical protein [Bryobacteraceae bacterium]